MANNETLDLLQHAILVLAQDGSVKDRLADAFTRHLGLLDPEQLPAEARPEFIALRTAMSRERPLPRESGARASARKMSADEAAMHAARVVKLYVMLARRAPVARRRKVPERRAALVAAVNAPIVKLFAAEN